MNPRNNLVRLICESRVPSTDCQSMLGKTISFNKEHLIIDEIDINGKSYTQENIIERINRDPNLLGYIKIDNDSDRYKSLGIEILEYDEEKQYCLLRKKVNTFPKRTNRNYFC